MIPKSLPHARSTWLFVFFGSLMGVFVLASMAAPREASLDFYNLSAQLLPALLLALLIEARVFNLRAGWDLRAHRWTGLWAALYALLVLGYLVAAEFVALHPLATGRASDGGADFVYGALATALTAVVLIGVFGSVGGTSARGEVDPPS